MKNSIDVFPIWSPLKTTLRKIGSTLNEKQAFKSFRNSSSGFVKNEIVRKSILEKCGNKCVNCNSVLNLEIDHKKSVYYCFKNGLLSFCNTYENLQILCKKCNTSKQP